MNIHSPRCISHYPCCLKWVILYFCQSECYRDLYSCIQLPLTFVKKSRTNWATLHNFKVKKWRLSVVIGYSGYWVEPDCRAEPRQNICRVLHMTNADTVGYSTHRKLHILHLRAHNQQLKTLIVFLISAIFISSRFFHTLKRILTALQCYAAVVLQ